MLNILDCDTTRCVDLMFEKLAQNRKLITQHMISDIPELLKGVLPTDNYCDCCLGLWSEIRSPYVCAACLNFRRLTSKAEFEILCGKMLGHSLCIKTTSFVKSSLYESNLLARMHNVKTCVVGDSFTIPVLIQWFFMDKIKYHILPIYTAYICNDTGYTVVENTSSVFDYFVGRRDKLKILKLLLIQLLVICHQLGNVSMHQVNTNSLSIRSKAVSYMYNGIKVSAPFTLVVNNFDKASAKIDDVYYCQNYELTSVKLNPFYQKISTSNNFLKFLDIILSNPELNKLIKDNLATWYNKRNNTLLEQIELL